jgi:hypothetical protein
MAPPAKEEDDIFSDDSDNDEETTPSTGLGYMSLLKIFLVIIVLCIIVWSSGFIRALSYIPGATNNGMPTMMGMGLQGLFVAMTSVAAIIMAQKNYI